jgi:hypothetical protein
MGNRLVVIEHRHRVREVDAVLALVRRGLAGIPLGLLDPIYARPYIPSTARLTFPCLARAEVGPVDAGSRKVPLPVDGWASAG